MTDKELSNQGTPITKTKDTNASMRKKTSRPLLIVFLVFFAFVAIVFLTQHKASINWVEDYQAGLELAKQQNKPVLLAFYKQFTPMCTSTFDNTYNNPDVKKFVEKIFIPILIDVDKQPEIAKRYHINYYPIHYIKRPDSDEIFGPVIGYKPPPQFIAKLQDLLKEMGTADK